MNPNVFKGVFSLICLFIMLASCEKKEDPIPTEIQDIDGNSYAVIPIGEQLWMMDNLKTTRFNDGTEIPLVEVNNEWSRLSTPGYCWYDNDANNKMKYGALYNWYTVDTNEFCPEGWHVPSGDEWAELEIYLENNGYNFDGFIDVDLDRRTNNKIGKAVTSTTGWKFSGKEGAIGNSDYPEYQNRSGFNAVPGGYRDGNGVSQSMNILGNFWSTSEHIGSNAWYTRFLNSSYKVIRDDHNKRDGFSVRCVQNKESD